MILCFGVKYFIHIYFNDTEGDNNDDDDSLNGYFLFEEDSLRMDL